MYFLFSVPEEIGGNKHEGATKPVWNLENGYGTNSELYPKRAVGAGSKVGLKVHISDLKDKDDALCSKNQQDFKIILHTPEEVPMASMHFFKVSLGQNILISINPQVMTTSCELRNYPN